MAQQININSSLGSQQAQIIADPNFPGVISATINSTPDSPGVLQVNPNSDPATSGLLYFIINSSPDSLPINLTLPVISGAAQVGQLLTTTSGAWTSTPSSFAYNWKSSKRIYTRDPTGGFADGSGYQLRMVLAASNLINPGITSGFIRVTFRMAPTASNATLNGAYIGMQGAGNPVDFDGGQVKLLNGGLGSISGLEANQVFTSDFVPFTGFDITKNLLLSCFWGGSNAGVSLATSHNDTHYFNNSDTDPSLTFPNYPGSWAWDDHLIRAIIGVDFAYVALGATSLTYTPVAGDVGNVLNSNVIATNAAGPSLPAASLSTVNVTP